MGDVELSQPGTLAGDDTYVQAAVDRLVELDTTGPDGSVEIYEDIYRSLSAALEGRAETPRPPE